MTSVENGLRSALHDLAPEPPDDLGLPGVALGRARVLRRRRHVGAVVASCTAVLALVLALGAPAALRRSEPDPAGPPGTGTFPFWPRRGDVADPAVDRAAIAAWDASLRVQGVVRSREPRVLYAGGGARTVVVLHAVADIGGERLVVLTREPRRAFTVYLDQPAPERGSAVVAVGLGAPPVTRIDARMPCPAVPAYRPGPERLLVLGGPGTRRAEWHLGVDRPEGCAEDGAAGWLPVPLRDGAGLVPVRLTGSSPIEVRAYAKAATLRGVHWARSDTAPYALRIVGGDSNLAPGWPRREDGSGTDRLGFDLVRYVSKGRPDGSSGSPVWSASLPDGTPAALYLARRGRGGAERMVLVAADPTGRARVYLDVRKDPLPSAFTAIVDGYEGRWLLVVGPATLREAALVDGGTTRTVPLAVGWGAVRLDAEPSKDAYLWTPDFPPGGGEAIQGRSGRPVPRGN
jgi:hypothetical protein